MLSKARSSFLLGLMVGVLVCVCVYAMFLRTQQGIASAPVKTLTLAHALDTSHPVHHALLHLKDKLETYSSGALTVEIHPSGVLGSEVQSIEQLQQGVLAITKTSAAAMESFVEEMKVFGLPYLFKDADHYWRVLESNIGRELLLKSQSKRLRGLTYYDAGSRNFYSRKKLIKTPDDLKGMKIRVMNSPMAMKMVEALGGAPTPISWGELYSALAQGIVDGAENNPPSYVSNKHYEVSPFFSLDAHTRIPDILMISQKIWDNLSYKEQQWLQQAADASSLYQRSLWAEKTRLALEEAKEKGVVVYQPDTQSFFEKAKPIYGTLNDARLTALVSAIQAMP